MLAGTVLLWGRLAERLGPPRIFWWGQIGFAVTSSACGAAPTLRALITARALQGLGPVLVPTLGGVLLTWTSWHVLFWMNLPLTISLIILRLRKAPVYTQPHPVESLGLIGNGGVLGTVSLGLLALTTPAPSACCV